MQCSISKPLVWRGQAVLHQRTATVRFKEILWEHARLHLVSPGLIRILTAGTK